MSFVREVGSGLSAYLAVLRFAGKAGMLRYVLLTAAIAMLLLVLIVAGAYVLAQPGLLNFGVAPGQGLQAELWALLKAVVWLSIGVLLFKRAVLVLASPWLGPLAERVIAFRQNPSYLSSRLKEPPAALDLFWRGLKLNVLLGLGELLLSLPLLGLSLIPGLGLLTGPALLAVQSYFVGAGAVDLSLEQRYDYRASRAYLRAHRGIALGVGIGFTVLLLTGIGFLLAPAWSVAAGAWAVSGAETGGSQGEVRMPFRRPGN